MKISREWLQAYFESALPDSHALADALTFHVFEIESVEGDMLDVKVTANRGHDCLCHRGIAKELSAILSAPMKRDPLREPIELAPVSNNISIDIQEPTLCSRYIAGYIHGVSVGPSPEWLQQRLESLGQKSINNIVDAANFVMFDLGQPLHAFDAEKLNLYDGYRISVRRAQSGEKMTALDGKEYAFSDSMLLISDANGPGKEIPIGIAGVKGGMPAAISEQTKDIIVESANFDGVSVRRTAQALKLRTDASSRFEQAISPELAAYGMRAAVNLILEIAGGKLEGFVDEYPKKPEKRTVAVSTAKINRVLGAKLRQEDVEDAFKRLNFSFAREGERFSIVAPFERLDLNIPEDLVEEVARIVGYDKVPAAELPGSAKKLEASSNFISAERAREDLIAKGYSEVFTSIFAESGERVVANKADGASPYLRATLLDGLRDAYEKNSRVKDLLGLKEVRVFEIGVVWKKGKEKSMLGIADEKGAREEPLQIASAREYEDLPISNASRYHPFSKYPFIVRDIAMWVPQNSQSFTDVVRIFGERSQGLLRHVDLFDQFQKGERVSYAFHLVFQSSEKTLTDEEANAVMEAIYAALREKGFEIR